MNVPRETVFAALFALAQSAVIAGEPAFKLTSRRAVMPDNAPAYPALYQTQGDETAKGGLRGMIVWELRAEWRIYLRNQAAPALTSPPLNAYLDLIDTLLLPQPPRRQQLVTNGKPLVEAAYVDGKVLTAENPLGDYAAILVPITIITGE